MLLTLALYVGQTRVNALLAALAQGPERTALAALLPEEITVLREVTGDADYKNRNLAALQKL